MWSAVLEGGLAVAGWGVDKVKDYKKTGTATSVVGAFAVFPEWLLKIADFLDVISGALRALGG
jgi:hypothetical protein